MESGSGDIDLLDLGFAVGLDLELDGHAEEVEILGDGSHGAEAFVIAEAEDGELVAEGGCSGAVEPLGEEGGDVVFGVAG